MGRERRKTRGRLRRGQKKSGEKQAGEEEERSSRPASGRVGAYGAASPAGQAQAYHQCYVLPLARHTVMRSALRD